MVRLIRDCLAQPHEILALAYNDRAAAELRERIGQACLELGVPPESDPVTVLTYHSFGNAIIGDWGGMIGLPPRPPLLSRSEQWLLLWDCLPRIDFRSINLLHLRGDYGSPLPKILNLGSRLKDELVTTRQLLDYLASLAPASERKEVERRGELADYAGALTID